MLTSDFKFWRRKKNNILCENSHARCCAKQFLPRCKPPGIGLKNLSVFSWSFPRERRSAEEEMDRFEPLSTLSRRHE
jgi:hypothetical protein